MSKSGGIRLYVEDGLKAGQDVILSRDQSHYLFGVMRRTVGDEVVLFNGHDGEWHATVSKSGKAGALSVDAQLRAQMGNPDIQLMFAPVKKARTDFIVEKAVELGVSQISPVFTDYTNSERVRVDRLERIAVEAAEQSRSLVVPTVDAPRKLQDALAEMAQDRALVFLNETETLGGGLERLGKLRLPLALLVGPEGGFSPSEVDMLSHRDGAVSVSLGPRILRADTAVVSGLSLIQAHVGDWT